MKRSILVALCVFASLYLESPTSCHSQGGARTVPRALDQLVEEADLIVHGYVVSAKIEPHPQLHNLMTVVVTMSVKDTYKGAPRKSLVFRQYVWDIDRRHDLSEYGKGEELILLLGPVSEYGLTSPVGLEQGRFRIVGDRDHPPTAVNGRGNVGLFDHVEERARKQGLRLSQHTAALVKEHGAGPVLLADLEDAIRTLARMR